MSQIPNDDQSTPPSVFKQPQPKKESGLKSVLSIVGILLLAPVIAFSLISWVFQSYEVYGPSMQETLQHKDRLIILKLPETWASIRNKPHIPERGDIIVFSRDASSEYSTGEEKQLIKRVIGLPGERVVVKNGSVKIYNQQNPTGFDPDRDQQYAKSISTTSGNVDLTVDEGQVFVLGDNRPNSLDSRVFGPISTDHIVGKLVLRIYPFNKTDSF